jgi:hypothetical protein
MGEANDASVKFGGERSNLSKPHTIWDDDRVQFPRLMAELRAVGLTQDQYAALCESMDLGVREIDGLLERAETAWNRIKECSHDDAGTRGGICELCEAEL